MSPTQTDGVLSARGDLSRECIHCCVATSRDAGHRPKFWLAPRREREVARDNDVSTGRARSLLQGEVCVRSPGREGVVGAS